MTFDVAVIGAGHAGVEAALASARAGCMTAVFSLQTDLIANMPCNPSIGGVAKGQIVREIDALGGEMGKLADKTAIQTRLLNRGKGPAVRGPRVQSDRRAYSNEARRALERECNVRVIQREIAEIVTENGEVCGIRDVYGEFYPLKAVVAASGVYLNSRVITGAYSREGGPDGLRSASGLSGSLKNYVPMRRFKTGTPPRIRGGSIGFADTEPQYGEADAPFFSFSSRGEHRNAAVCRLTWTNDCTHGIIRANISRSPLFDGSIKGVGPRYCPSIEDKITRFPDKERHPLFLEPMGLDTDEWYLQGFSSSLPADVQQSAMNSVRGLERAEMTRPAYAIEYDCLDPTCLNRSLMVRRVPGLFAAGQFCGTSGYEEAACQGLVAGVNAARFALGKPPVSLTRQSSYIGTLIDDLVTKGAEEPYRMMTSRSEHRMLLRHDNADLRLSAAGYEWGLVSAAFHSAVEEKRAAIEREIRRLEKARLDALLRRPEVKYADVGLPGIDPAVAEQAELEIKYAGYIRRQSARAKDAERYETLEIPEGADFRSIPGLSSEAALKLGAARPETLGAAGRIFGVSPADVTALLLYFRRSKWTT